MSAHLFLTLVVWSPLSHNWTEDRDTGFLLKWERFATTMANFDNTKVNYQACKFQKNIFHHLSGTVSSPVYIRYYNSKTL